MFESLYISKSRIRRDLLALFYTNPGQKYYLRELGRLLGCSVGSLRRELLRFQHDGLFLTERKGNLVFYSLNSAHPLHGEMKGIVAKTVGVVGSLKQVLSSVPRIQAAFIYGSFASNHENPASDIDVFIIGETSLADLSKVLRGVQKRLMRDINPTLYARDEYVKRKAEASGFLKDVLMKPKIMLIGNEDDL
jgi:predicted nucleotidyltransferase